MLKKRDVKYFKKMIGNLSTPELMALMQAITEYGMEMANITTKFPLPKKKENKEDMGIQ